jgi:hypothetical protein
MSIKRIFLVAITALSLVSSAFAQTAITAPDPSFRVTLGQSRIPMILPSSGTMGNSGALTLTTALDQAYAAAYFYMPAGAIVTASAAGFYYGTMSSTTAVTLFNNPYVSGSPAIPASPTAFATTGPGAYTQTTGTSLGAWTMTLAGGTLGINDEVQAHGLITFNNSAGIKTFGLVYGSYTVSFIGPSTLVQQPFASGFVNAGILTRQTQVTAPSMNYTGSTTLPAFGSVNSAANQTLVANLKIATATDYVILQDIVLEQIKAANN